MYTHIFTHKTQGKTPDTESGASGLTERALMISFGLCYEVATISRLLTFIGLFCKKTLQKRPIFCKTDL